jgi:hypothetical protein
MRSVGRIQLVAAIAGAAAILSTRQNKMYLALLLNVGE